MEPLNGLKIQKSADGKNLRITLANDDVKYMSWDAFLMSLECIALDSEFRLCMERAPVGCGIRFYFRDGKSGLRSSEVVFFYREGPEDLFARLEELAAEFRKRLDENKESFETYDKVVAWENEVNKL